MSDIIRIGTVTEAHELLRLEPPKHPLISVMDVKDMPDHKEFGDARFALDLYIISLKDGVTGSMGYGRNTYDFTNGTMIFSKPNQVFTSGSKEIEADAKGWMLIFHPDLIRSSELGANVDNYTFFSYEVNEALHLSEEEKKTVTEVVRKIEKEYSQMIDAHSQKLIISNLELLMNYCTRYYDRQFYVRTNHNKDLISSFERLLNDYYSSDKPIELGLPTVQYCGDELNMSPNYLSDLLKKETGTNAKDHIYSHVINNAKNKLLGTNEPVSAIAYNLGFGYPQHFSKLFKKKVGLSPVQYRSLN